MTRVPFGKTVHVVLDDRGITAMFHHVLILFAPICKRAATKAIKIKYVYKYLAYLQERAIILVRVSRVDIATFWQPTTVELFSVLVIDS